MKINPEIVRELLHYDPETGHLTWRERDRRWFKTGRDCRAWNTRFAGKRAGRVWTNPKGGYKNRQMTLLGLPRKEHHLAWLWMTDEPLPPEIDHENRDGTDNRWCNLRASDRVNNARNMSLSRRNTSGVSGVYWDKKCGKWQAACVINRRNRHLGLFSDRDEAARVVREFRAANGFSPGHGMEPAHYHA